MSDESLDQYYDESLDQSESKSKKDYESDDSDVTVKALKRKLDALRNNEMDPEEAEKRYQEDLKINREKKEQKKQQKLAQKKKKEEEINQYEDDFGSDKEEEIKMSQSKGKNEQDEDYEEKFEVHSNSFSIRSKQSIASLKMQEDEDDNKAYTLKQTLNESKNKIPSKQSLPSISKTPQSSKTLKNKQTAIPKAAPSVQQSANSNVTRPQSGNPNILKKAELKKPPTNTGLGQDKAKLANAVKLLKAPTAAPKKEESKQVGSTTKLTQHQLDQQKKKQEIDESESKALKQPKLPNLKNKMLKVNNFMKDNADEKKKAQVQKEQNEQRKPKDELDDNIFGENEKEKGDQALAPGDQPEQESEESLKLKEKQRRQEILKQQKEKRKDQLGSQWDKVKQILSNHEEKQKEMKEKEDLFFIKEAVEKMKQKKVKQNLQYEKEESNWVDVTRKDHIGLEKQERENKQDQFRQKMLQNLKTEEENLKKKKANEEATSKIIQSQKIISESKVSTKNELKEKKWDGNLAQKKGTLHELSKIESEKNEIIRENELQMHMKQVERKKYLEQLEVEKQLKKKALEFVKEGQDLQKKNKALDNIDKILQQKDGDKKKKEKERNYQYEEQQKEKSEQDELEKKKLRVILRQLNEENKQIKDCMEKAKAKQEAYKAQIQAIKTKEGVVVLGENKFTSFGLVPALNKKSQDSHNVSTADEGDSINVIDKINDQEKRQITQLTVIELIVHKITEQGLTLADIFSLLDVNKDGILTINEIELNMGKLDLNLTEEEIQEMIKIIDTNKDGVINEFEFVKNLETQYQSQKEYNRVMGELKDIQNPIVLQERVLDLEVRQKVVLKCIKKEEEKQISKGPEYEKYLARLKKQEEAFEKRQKIRKKETDLTQLTAKGSQLKLELRKLEDEKEMIVIMGRERMEAIEENIAKLTEELIQMCEIVIKAKNVVDKERNDYEKLVIKQVSIDRLQEQINQQRQLKEIEQQKQAHKFQSNIKQKAKNVLYEQQRKMTAQSVIGAAILLQKIYRGWKSRVQAKKRKQLLLRAVQFIQTYYWFYMKKKKFRMFVKKIDILFRRRRLLTVKMLQIINYHMQRKPAPKQALISIRPLLSREEYAFIDQRQAQIQIFNNKTKKSAALIEEDVFGQEASESGANSSSMQYQQPQYERKSKKDITDVITDFRPQELPAVITLQRGLRLFKNKVNLNNENKVTFTMGGISSNCRICDYNKVEILCRSCEQCIFCKSCYDKFHKSYHRRNHRFYELNPSEYSSYDIGQNKAQKEEVQKILNNYLNDLKKLFQMDMNTGFFPLDQVYNFFETRIIEFKINKGLFQAAQVYTEKCIDKKNQALFEFQQQNIEQKFDHTKQYIDHVKFVRSFYSINKEKQ